MANFDEQLSRMHYLMGYKMPVTESKSGVEHSVVAADGKRYGIIKEGTKFYVKVSDAAKENIAESYDYINGVLAKKENEHKSYNSASKALELKLMSLNEAHNGNVKTSLFDSKGREKMFANLTEEARKELNRMHQIFEASNVIGKNNTGNPEAPKTASFSEKIGKPFDITAKAELDKDFKKTANNPENQSEPFDAEVKVTDADMESDKMPSSENNNCEEYEDAKYVPDGSVANQKPTGGKVVRVNETIDIEKDVIKEDDDIVGIEKDTLSDENLESLLDDEVSDDEEFTIDASEFGFDRDEEPDPRFAGITLSDEDFLDSIDGYEREMPMESKVSLKRIVESVCDNMMREHSRKMVKESFNDKLVRIIKEEITNLDVWGQHPGYRKAPMTIPSNKEVIVNMGDRDWNDDSVKGSEYFGSKIGNSAPFTDDVVKQITDIVVSNVKTILKKK